MKPAASITHWFTAAIAPSTPIRPPRHSGKLIHILYGFGVFGLFLVSIVDSSIVPLPIPGITDIMLIVMAAHHQNFILLVLFATAGSAIGGYTCYQAGRSGGMGFIQKRTPPRIFSLVTEWVERHAILAVALPAILPPPVPLTPFVLAAGALKMSRNKFLTTFTLSRALRHAIAVWLGIHYGRHIVRVWNHFSARWATTILTILWTTVTISVAIALWRLYKTSRAVATREPAI
jgi:membrane protein YqaA with SNARE-associated domain